jgi:hypothetical protein
MEGMVEVLVEKGPDPSAVPVKISEVTEKGRKNEKI